MELNKVNATTKQDATYVAPNQKIECKDGNCYLVDIVDSDEENSVILNETETIKKEEGQKEASEIVTLDKNSFKDIRNQKGTTFVIVGGTSCSRCKKLDKNLEEINDTIGKDATITTLTLPDKATSNNEFYKIYWELKKESNASDGSHGYPIIIKLVDGVATDFYDYTNCGNVYQDAEKMTKWLSKKIEGTKESSLSKTEESGNTEDEKSVEETSKTETAESTESTKKEIPSYLENLLGLNNDKISDYAKEYVITEIKCARKIMDLKKMLFNLGMLDIQTQLDVMDAINEIKFDDDLESAKASILIKLS